MALTDTEIRKAKATNKAYNMSDGGGLYLGSSRPAGSSGAGPIGLTAKRS
jgi:hypothetical protein